MTATTKTAAAPRPLDGVRVLELGQFLAGPFAGTVLGYFGAEVIKVEAPEEGDQIRRWRVMDNGTSYWWRSLGRNKKCVTIDLKSPTGQSMVRQLATQSDVVVENFRPGVLEGWGLGPEQLKADKPDLIYARISGYGQTGPYAKRPGYASVSEGFGGFRYLNGFPGQPPVRPNLSIGDTLAGLHAALGVVMALRQRDRHGNGQTVDVALFESMFNLLEAVVPEFDGAGITREPSGSTITGIVPTNTYLCRGDRYVIIGGNGDSIYRRLMSAVGRDDLASAPDLANNDGRVKRQAEIDSAIADWTARHTVDEVLSVMDQARVPAGPIYDIADMLADPHYQARGLFEQVEIDGKPLKIPAIMPKLSATPGATTWPGPGLGHHNHEVFSELLDLDAEQQAALAAKGII